MSEVSVTVGGRTYRVACAAGEEDRVRRLGASVNAKLESMGQLGPQDAQNLLFASLMLADDAHEAQERANKAIAAQDQAKHEAHTAQSAQATLQSTIENLESETVRLKNAEARTASELESARTQIEILTRQVADLSEANKTQQTAAPSDRAGKTDAMDPNLAPALERFAEQLEICADRLEGKASAS